MFTNSIRWRLQLWSGLMLLCVLSGFGITASRLHRISQFNQIDEELKRRVAALSINLRGGPGHEHGPGHDHGASALESGLDKPDVDEGMNPRRFPHEHFDMGSPRGPGMRSGGIL